MKKLVLSLLMALCLVAGVNAQSKIAHVNTAELMNAMPEMKEFEEKLKAHENLLRKQLEEMQNELQTNYYAYLNDTISPDAVMEIKKKKLEDLQANIQQFAQTAEQEMTKKKETLYLPIYNKAKTAISEVAKAKGYDYVLDSSEGLGVLVVQPANDIINDVKKKLGIN
ncbi:MAG: OmpH family outer membrane protein [Flavobacteriales bacterium]|nr:OmpH family outer membrane protein [Flavobacteriales bacterium]